MMCSHSIVVGQGILIVEHQLKTISAFHLLEFFFSSLV